MIRCWRIIVTPNFWRTTLSWFMKNHKICIMPHIDPSIISIHPWSWQWSWTCHIAMVTTISSHIKQCHITYSPNTKKFKTNFTSAIHLFPCKANKFSSEWKWIIKHKITKYILRRVSKKGRNKWLFMYITWSLILLLVTKF